SKKDWLHGTTKLPRGGPPAGSCPKFWVNRSPKRPENEVVPGLRPYPVGVATNRGSVWERAKVERARIATIKSFFIFFILQTFSGEGESALGTPSRFSPLMAFFAMSPLGARWRNFNNPWL